MMITSLLAWIGAGIAAGLLARLAMTNASGQPYNLGGTLMMGILGAVLGGWIGQETFRDGGEFYSLSSVFMAFVGGVIVVAFLRLLDRERYTT
jgi:uncharacterized membrane protein YeaQ/YmgE (transglycosylase-associated protein family)